MGTNFLKLVLLITATPILFGSSCNKDGSKPCRNAPYSFDVTSEFSPQKEIYNVGDTIFLTSSFPKNLTSIISNQQVDYSNSLGISGNFNTLKMDTINKVSIEGLSNFKVVNLTGTSTAISNSPNLGVNIFFTEGANSYNAKFGLKLESKGLFYIGVTDLSSQGLRGQDCTNAGFNMTVINSNKNLNLFQYALGYSPDAMLAKYIYCFRVQ
jgi:hypothetical protein